MRKHVAVEVRRMDPEVPGIGGEAAEGKGTVETGTRTN